MSPNPFGDGPRHGRWTAAAGLFVCLFMGCGAPARRGAAVRAALPEADHAVFFERLKATGQGRKLLTISQPIEIVYGGESEKNLIGHYEYEEDRNHRPLKHLIVLHPHLRRISPSHPMFVLSAAHELTHAYQQALLSPKDRSLLYYNEEDAYASAIRVWIELDPDKRETLPRGLVTDFEGLDLAVVLEEMRAVYERSLEEFADMIRLRYHRLCLVQSPGACGEFTSLREILTTTADPNSRLGWELLKREDLPFRARQ